MEGGREGGRKEGMDGGNLNIVIKVHDRDFIVH